jgi:Ran GTPase-activating protein (RanGAP) involved in mRNA processing and transport
LKGNGSLRELDLGRNFHNNFITGTGAEALFSALAQQGCLEKLILEGNKCLDHDKALASLAHLLKKTTTLKCLDLGSTGLTSAGMASLAPALAQNSTLHTLNISGNQLGAAGLDILIDVFRDQACKSVIENLQCSALDIDEDGLSNLGKWMSSNPALCELGLGVNRFSNNKALCLLQALASNFQLSYLDLRYAHFDEQGLIVLLEVMQARNIPLRLTLGYHKVSWSRDEDALARLRSVGLAISWDSNN